MPRKATDLTGFVSGRLTILSRAENSKQGTAQWLCRCSCPAATEKVIRSEHLLRNMTKSCGCLRKEGKIEGSALNIQLLRHKITNPHIEPDDVFIKRFLAKIQAGCEFDIPNIPDWKSGPCWFWTGAKD